MADPKVPSESVTIRAPRKLLMEMYPVSVPKPGYAFGDSSGGADMALQDSWLDGRQQHPLAPHTQNGAFAGALDPLIAGMQAYDENVYQPFRGVLPWTAAYDELMEQSIPAFQQQGFGDYEAGHPVKGIAKIAAGEAANAVGSIFDITDPGTLLGFGLAAKAATGLRAMRKRAADLDKLIREGNASGTGRYGSSEDRAELYETVTSWAQERDELLRKIAEKENKLK